MATHIGGAIWAREMLLEPCQKSGIYIETRIEKLMQRLAVRSTIGWGGAPHMPTSTGTRRHTKAPVKLHQYPYGGLVWNSLPADLRSVDWLPNANVVLQPDPLPSWWQDIVYWVSGFLFSAGVVLTGISSRSNDCDPDGGPGPCFFHYYSHWCYIWFSIMFFRLAMARFSWIVRSINFITVWFDVGTVVAWAVMTLGLIITTTKDTVESMLPDSDDADVGLAVIIMLALHFYPFVVIAFVYLPHWGQRIGIFWNRQLSALILYAPLGVGLLAATFLLAFMIWSPAIGWALYLIWWNPYIVYDVSERFAEQFPVGYALAIATMFITGAILAAYLHWKVRQLMIKRIIEYQQKVHPMS